VASELFVVWKKEKVEQVQRCFRCRPPGCGGVRGGRASTRVHSKDARLAR